MLKLSMKCTRFESNYKNNTTYQTSENVAVVLQGLRQKERYWMELVFAPKLVQI
jgi:hypothetical protein